MGIAESIAVQEGLVVVVRTVVVFFFVFFILRLLGKRHLAHLTYMDLLLVIALGSAVGDVMIYDESVARLFASMIAIGVVGLIIKILSELSYASKSINWLIAGGPRMIIHDGHVIQENLDKEDMNEEELMALLREKGVHSLSNIQRAFIEADGEISMVFRRHRGKKSN